ncbi:MAG: hypothetical protein ACR2RB_14720 [Gammaproteobacteria bacterium]
MTQPPLSCLKLDAFRLAVPQSDVKLLDSAGTIDTSNANGLIAGWHTVDGQRCPVFATGELLHPVGDIVPQRKYCVCLSTGIEIYGLLVDDFSSPPSDMKFTFQPLPICMSDLGSFIHQVTVIDDDIYCISNAQALSVQFPLGEALQ